MEHWGGGPVRRGESEEGAVYGLLFTKAGGNLSLFVKSNKVH